MRRGRKRHTTTPESAAARPPDLVQRQFTAARPDRRWVADLTHVRTWEGWVYVAFVLDLFSRLIVSWQLASHLRTDLPLDALEMAILGRQVGRGALAHQSNAGCQYTSFRYTSRVAEVSVVPSIGSVADSFDTAMAESLIETFKAELIDRQRWRTRDEVEFAVVELVAWYNTRRLHSSIGDIPPAEFETNYYASAKACSLPKPHNQGHASRLLRRGRACEQPRRGARGTMGTSRHSQGRGSAGSSSVLGIWQLGVGSAASGDR